MDAQRGAESPAAGRWALSLVALAIACFSQEAPPARTPSRFPPSSSLAGRCDPGTEKQWVRSILDEEYLWATEIVDVDAGVYATPGAYFDALLVRTPTASGRPRDRFSAAYPTSALAAAIYWHGVRWTTAALSDVRALYVRPGTPAALAGLQRGDRLLAIGGAPPGQLGAAAVLSALYPPSDAQTVDLTVVSPAGTTRTVTLKAVSFDDPGVLLDTVLERPGGKVGYLAFTSQLGSPVPELDAAFGRFADAGVTDLVLDVRYNPGGTMDVVASAGEMIGGTHVQGRTFAYVSPNQRVQQARVDAGQPADWTVVFAGAEHMLSLGRVYVLTTEETCSATEALINGLAPFVTVEQVGGVTCGKPYGFDLLSNCGTTYFLLSLQVSNAEHRGDYADGLVPGCRAMDDLSHALGDPAEEMLAAALAVRESGPCPPTSSGASAPPARSEGPDLSALRWFPANGL